MFRGLVTHIPFPYQSNDFRVFVLYHYGVRHQWPIHLFVFFLVWFLRAVKSVNYLFSSCLSYLICFTKGIRFAGRGRGVLIRGEEHTPTPPLVTGPHTHTLTPLSPLSGLITKDREQSTETRHFWIVTRWFSFFIFFYFDFDYCCITTQPTPPNSERT